MLWLPWLRAVNFTTVNRVIDCSERAPKDMVSIIFSVFGAACENPVFAAFRSDSPLFQFVSHPLAQIEPGTPVEPRRNSRPVPRGVLIEGSHGLIMKPIGY